MGIKKPQHINYSFENYNKIINFLFDNNIFINGCNLNTQIIKIKKLILIEHKMTSLHLCFICFHKILLIKYFKKCLIITK
jgi:hypothetical protein